MDNYPEVQGTELDRLVSRMRQNPNKATGEAGYSPEARPVGPWSQLQRGEILPQEERLSEGPLSLFQTISRLLSLTLAYHLDISAGQVPTAARPSCGRKLSTNSYLVHLLRPCGRTKVSNRVS